MGQAQIRGERNWGSDNDTYFLKLMGQSQSHEEGDQDFCGRIGTRELSPNMPSFKFFLSMSRRPGPSPKLHSSRVVGDIASPIIFKHGHQQNWVLRKIEVSWCNKARPNSFNHGPWLLLKRRGVVGQENWGSPNLNILLCFEEEGVEEIVFNSNNFNETKLIGSPVEVVAHEDNVKEVSLDPTDVVLPKFIQDLCMLEVSPMDGQTLTKKLHAHGINVCYISNVAGGTIHLPHLWELHNNEIVVKYARHVIKDLLQDTGVQDHALAISHSYYAYSFFEKQSFIDDVFQKGENVAASGSGILPILAQKLLQGENQSQV